MNIFRLNDGCRIWIYRLGVFFSFITFFGILVVMTYYFTEEKKDIMKWRYNRDEVKGPVEKFFFFYGHAAILFFVMFFTQLLI